MSSVPEQNRFAPPVARLEDVDESGTLALGGRGARLGAVILDGVIQAVIYYGLAFTIFPMLRPDRIVAANGAIGALILQLAIGLGSFAVLQGYLLMTRGQTIGKLLLGLRIVRSDGSKATIGRILLLRYGAGLVLTMIPIIGAVYAIADSLMIFRNSRKCLHDNIADTIVIKV